MIQTVVVINDYGSVCNAPSQIAIDSALSLADRGMQVVYFCAVSPVDSRLCRHPGVKAVCTAQWDLLNCPSKPAAMVQGLWNGLARRMLSRELAPLLPDRTVLHFHLWAKALSPSLLWQARSFGAPVFITAHEYYTLCPNGALLDFPRGTPCKKQPLSWGCLLLACDRRGRLHKQWRVLRQWVQNAALGAIGNLTLLAPSRLSQSTLARYAPGRRICYHPNFVRQLPGAKSEFSFSNNIPYLFIGRLEPEKGISIFCEALARLGLAGVAIGGAASAQELDLLRRRWPHVTFTGKLPWEAIVSHISTARALVFPSIWAEGMGLVPFEVQKNYAMPCIVADGSAPRQLIVPGKTGLLFQSGSVASLMRALTVMQDDVVVRAMTVNIAAMDFAPYELNSHCDALLHRYHAALGGQQ